MLTVIDKSTGVKQSRLQGLRETVIAWASGLAVAAAAFQAIYWTIFALE